jgi:hypothetical protein
MRAIPPTLKVSLSFGRSRAHEHADAPNPVKLLRSRRERPRRCTPPRSVKNSRRLMSFVPVPTTTP